MSIKEKRDDSMLLDCVITTNALKKITAEFKTVVSNMVKSGQKVPQIYKDFINIIDPEAPTDKEIVIENKPPLYKLTGLDEFGNVKVETETPLEIKRGDVVLKLNGEKLKTAVEKKIHTIPREPDPFNSPMILTTEKNGNIRFPSLKNCNEEEIKNYLGLDENGVLKKIEIPQSVNKNAYEVRSDILKYSIDWIKYECDRTNSKANSNDVLDVATKFYRFVENKRQ